MMRFLILSAALLAADPAFARMDRDPGAALANADANGDGTITRGEYQQARVARFAKADRNHDGAISRDDFKRLARFRPEAAERLNALLAEADANGDGRVSRDELAKAPMPIFDRADANGDAKVDRAELASFKAKAAEDRERR